MIDQKFFYDTIRSSLFGGRIRPNQFIGLQTILTEWDANYSNNDLRFLAYMLATVHHETDKTFQPLEEYGKGKNYDYGRKLKMGKGPGKRIPYTTPNKLYYGRGFVQLTWYENYAKVAKKLNIDCLENPEIVMQLPIATTILMQGMIEGWFTGKKLKQYFSKKNGKLYSDWIHARRIINGKDKANLIKDFALNYYNALQYTVPV